MEFRRLKKTLTDLLSAANEDGVIVLDSERPGPTFAISALTHGDEISGLLTLARLYEAVKSGHLPLDAGRLLLVLANYEILLQAETVEQVTRHRGVDLNRVWEQNDPVIRHGNVGAGELAVRERLLPWVAKADHLVDLHSTGQPSTPMGILVSQSPEICARVLDVLDVDWVFQNIHEYLNGVSLIERHQIECLKRDPQAASLSLVIEAGQHADLSTVDRNVRNVMHLIAATGMSPAVAPRGTDAPTALDVYQVGLAQSSGDIINWRYTKSPASFDRVSDGTEICSLHDELIVANGDSFIVMPRLKAISAGDEMFYLSRLSG